MGKYNLHAYHTAPFPYRNVADKPGELYGIELEMEHKVSADALLASIPDIPQPHLRPITETDGSLNSTGVEIIFPPLKMSQLTRKNGFFQRTLTSLKEGGAKTSRSTGMHVNVNIYDWSELERAVFFILHHVCFSNHLYKAIGGRHLNDYCSRSFDPTSYGQSVTIAAAYNNVRYSRHLVISLRNSRFELRYPQASLDLNRLLLVISFTRLVRSYIRTRFVPRLTVASSAQQLIGLNGGKNERRLLDYIMRRKNSDAKRVKEALINAGIVSNPAASTAVIRRTKTA